MLGMGGWQEKNSALNDEPMGGRECALRAACVGDCVKAIGGSPAASDSDSDFNLRQTDCRREASVPNHQQDMYFHVGSSSGPEVLRCFLRRLNRVEPMRWGRQKRGLHVPADGGIGLQSERTMMWRWICFDKEE
jgi:hypothetical protein